MFVETLAPYPAVNTLVVEIIKTIKIFIYPIEYNGRPSLSKPVIVKVIAPGKAIKKPKKAEVPTASWIFFENIVKVGTLKLPPPIPIIAEKKPINELIKKLINFEDGKSGFSINGFCWKSIFIEIKKANIIKVITRFSPEVKLAESDPKIEPKTIPKAHFFTIFRFVFFNFKCDLIDEIDVKHITPREEAIATCITTSEPYPNCNNMK